MPVTIVSIAPVEILMRWSPGLSGPSSFHSMIHFGLVALGQSAIISRFGPATPLVTTRALRPGASVTSLSGLADAVAASIDLVDEVDRPWVTPNCYIDLDSSMDATSWPKSIFALVTSPPKTSINVQATLATKESLLVCLIFPPLLPRIRLEVVVRIAGRSIPTPFSQRRPQGDHVP